MGKSNQSLNDIQKFYGNEKLYQLQTSCKNVRNLNQGVKILEFCIHIILILFYLDSENGNFCAQVHLLWGNYTQAYGVPECVSSDINGYQWIFMNQILTPNLEKKFCYHVNYTEFWFYWSEKYLAQLVEGEQIVTWQYVRIKQPTKIESSKQYQWRQKEMILATVIVKLTLIWLVIPFKSLKMSNYRQKETVDVSFTDALNIHNP